MHKQLVRVRTKIDCASFGVSLGASDIAIHIPHAVHPRDLNNVSEKELHYQVFEKSLVKKHNPPATGITTSTTSSNNEYTFDAFMRHYKFARVDYFRFILGRMWKGLSMEVFEKRKNLKNFAEFNRTLEAAIAFIIRVDMYLTEIEAEMMMNVKD